VPSTDLQRLFYRTANSLVSPLEDFLSEVLRVAILHDGRPLLRMLAGVPEDRWREPSGLPELDVAPDGATRVLEVETQHILDETDDLESGRLDVRVVLVAGIGHRQEVWIEAKVDAPLTRRPNGRTQLDVYLDHRAACALPRPVLVTLAKEPSLDPRVTGLTWKELTEAVAPGVDDRWWGDLVAFLRADGIAPSPIPDEPHDPAAFMSVFKAANQCLKELSVGAPMSLRWPAIEKAVIGGSRSFTAGPMTWGMDHTGGHWAWFVSMANHGYPGVTVPVDEVLGAARRVELLGRGWARIDRQQRKRIHLFEKRRTFVGGEADLEIGAWFCEAFHDLVTTEMFEPHFKRVRAKQAKRTEKIAALNPT
jgi:hypothetical protein